MFLPGCSKPLEPPVPVSSIPRPSAECDLSKAEAWLGRNVLPSYWVKEVDGKNKYPLQVSSENESAHLLRKLENFYVHQGRPVDDNVQVSAPIDLQVLPNFLNDSSPGKCHSHRTYLVKIF